MSTLLNRVNRWASTKCSADQKRRLRSFRELLCRWSGQSLADLAELHGTDKWSLHGYLQHYEHHFSKFRKKPINLLEIGIGGYDDPARGGASLRMWKSWFPRAHIHGIDIYDKTGHAESRIHTYQGSQVDEQFLENLVDQIGRIDLIIDDGSHINEHVIQSFRILFPKLSVGGIYVIEDLQTSYWPEYGGDPVDLQAPHTSLNYLKSLVDALNYREWKNSDDPADVFETSLAGIHFYPNVVFIEKGVNRRAARSAKTSADAGAVEVAGV